MTIFIRGNDKGFVLLGTLIVLFCVSILFFSVLELKYSEIIQTKNDYSEFIEKNSKVGGMYE